MYATNLTDQLFSAALPLKPLVAWCGSACSVTVAVPPAAALAGLNVGSVGVTLSLPDGSNVAAQAVHVANTPLWTATFPASNFATAGTVTQGLMVTLAGEDEHGEVRTWIVAKGDLEVREGDASPSPSGSWVAVKLRDSAPENPVEGDAYVSENELHIFVGGEWVGIGGAVDPELSLESENPVQNRAVAAALTGKVAKSGDTMTGGLAVPNLTVGSRVVDSVVGTNSVAEGDDTKASGDFSHAEGGSTEASNLYSHAEGDGTKASGEASHAEGGSTKASGDFSHAEGGSTEASNLYSHAEGDGTKASGEASHAEGERTKASGNRSHAEGYRTEASGVSSHAEGTVTKASGNRSHAEGTYTEAKNESEHAQGQFNVSHLGSTDAEKTLSSIGFGSSIDDHKNAVETMHDGKTYIYGLGNYDGTNPGAAQDLAQVVNTKRDMDDLSYGGGTSEDWFVTASTIEGSLRLVKANDYNWTGVYGNVQYALVLDSGRGWLFVVGTGGQAYMVASDDAVNLATTINGVAYALTREVAADSLMLVSQIPTPVAPSTGASAQGKPADAKATGDLFAGKADAADLRYALVTASPTGDGVYTLADRAVTAIPTGVSSVRLVFPPAVEGRARDFKVLIPGSPRVEFAGPGAVVGRSGSATPQFVEYVEATGTQWIDTGVVGRVGTRVTAKFMHNAGVTSYPVLVGAYHSGAKRFNIVGFYGEALDMQYAGKAAFAIDEWGYVPYGGTYSVDSGITAAGVWNAASYAADGSVIRSKTVDVSSYGLINTGLTMGVFATNTDYGPLDFSRDRLYGLKIWQDGILVRDFRPCAVDGGGALYDAVSGAVFKSKTDPLSAGPAVSGASTLYSFTEVRAGVLLCREDHFEEVP